MEKTKEQLIKDYLKSNKQRREKILAKAGVATQEDYFAKLNNKTIKKAPKKAAKKKEMLDYVVAFDTTGSMGSYIQAVKKHVRELIPTMFSQEIDLKMRIIAFGDYCDMRNGQFGNAYQQSDFTDNQNSLIEFIQKAKNTSGGDEDEFYELVIKKIVEETPWRKDARKAVLFIADCNPHPVNYIGINYKPAGIDWRVEAKKAAELNISFDTLSIHGDRYPWYKELASITKGVYMPFQSSEKMADVVAASAYVRGSRKSKKTFETMAFAASVSGDSELIGTYKSLSSLLED